MTLIFRTPACRALALATADERAHRRLLGRALWRQRHEHRWRARGRSCGADTGATSRRASNCARLEAALVGVHMRIGRVGDQCVRRRDHRGGDIGVRVERGDDRHARPDECAHRAARDPPPHPATSSVTIAPCRASSTPSARRRPACRSRSECRKCRVRLARDDAARCRGRIEQRHGASHR